MRIPRSEGKKERKRKKLHLLIMGKSDLLLSKEANIRNSQALKKGSWKFIPFDFESIG